MENLLVIIFNNQASEDVRLGKYCGMSGRVIRKGVTKTAANPNDSIFVNEGPKKLALMMIWVELETSSSTI